MKNRVVYLLLLIFGIWLLILTFYRPKQQAQNITFTQNKIIGFTTDITKIADKLKENVAILENKKGLATAFLYKQTNNKGYFLTSNTVLDGEKVAVLRLANTYQISAKVVAEDKTLGVSVLEADLPYKINDLEIGDSDVVKSGELLICLGAINSNVVGPNLEMVASPLISTKKELLYKHKYISSYKHLGLLANPLKSSNLGGPLFNIAGQLVGLATFASKSEDINAYIPSNHLDSLMSLVIKGEEVIPTDFGFALSDIKNMPSYLRSIKGIKLDIIFGFYVEDVLPETIAASAGLRKGDILLSINGIICHSEKDLATLRYQQSKQYEFKIYRQQEEKILKTEVLEK